MTAEELGLPRRSGRRSSANAMPRAASIEAPGRAAGRHARAVAAEQRRRREAARPAAARRAAIRGRSRWSASRSPSPATTWSRSSRARLGQALLDKRAPLYVRTGVLVTNLGVHFKLGRENSLVWVTTLDRGQAGRGRRRRGPRLRGKRLWSGRTDAHGPGADRRCALDPEHRRVPGRPRLLRDRARGVADGRVKAARTDVAFVFSSWQKGIEAGASTCRPASGAAARPARHTVFDRTLLRAGETVSMKHFVRLETATGPGRGAAGRPADRRQDRPPGQRRGARAAADLERRGRSAVTTWSIPPAAKLGVYEVVARARAAMPARRGERGRHAAGRAASSASRSSACRWSMRACAGRSRCRWRRASVAVACR